MSNDSVSKRADEFRPVDVTKHPEILLVAADADHVSCNGTGGKDDSGSKAAGHPRVYYTFHAQDEVVCGYCDRLFTKVPQAGARPYAKDPA